MRLTDNEYNEVRAEGMDAYDAGRGCPYTKDDPRYSAWWDGYDFSYSCENYGEDE